MKKLIILCILILTSTILGQRSRDPYVPIIGYDSMDDTTSPAQMGAIGVRRWRNVPLITAENFDDPDQWSTSDAIDAANTTEVLTSALDVPASMKVTGDGTGTSPQDTKTGGGYGNIHNCHVFLRYYIHEGVGTADPSQIIQIQVFLSSAGFSDYITLGIYDGTYGENYPGWHEVVQSLDSCSMSVGDREALYSGLDTIRVKVITSAADNTVSVTFDTIQFYPAMTQPKYAFTFDDGRDMDWPFATYLHSKGLRATFYIIGSQIGGAGALTMDQLHSMQDMGHLIANHGWTNFNWENDPTSDEELREEITRTAELLCANGFTRGARIFALPSGTGALPEGGRDQFYKYYDQIRLTAGYSAPALDPDRNGFLHTGVIEVGAFSDTTKAATALAGAISYNTIAVTGWHSGDVPGSYSWANWKTHVDAVAAARLVGDIDVVTMDELVYEADDYNIAYADKTNNHLLSSTSVDLNSATDSILFIIPPGRTAIITEVVMHDGSTTATAVDITLGQVGALTDWLGTQNIDALTTETILILKPVPHANTPLATPVYQTGDVFSIDVTGAKGSACICTVDVFGYLN